MVPYAGTIDPTVHLRRYFQLMDVVGATEKVMCRCFCHFFLGLATIWFSRLVPGSINTWSGLKLKLMSQFRVYVIHSKDKISLTNIKQKNVETLRNHLARLNAAIDTIRQPDEHIVHIAVTSI